MRRTTLIVLILCRGLLALPAAAGERPPPTGKEGQLPVPQILDDTPELFVPLKPRSEADKERLEALSLFAAGRMKEHQQDLLGALRLYQRALRHDPKALPVLEQIVPLAFSLNRPTEGVRYALKAVELDPSDAQLLKRLGAHLSEQGDFKGAVKLYEKALSLESDKKTASYVLMKLELGRLHYLLKDYPQAASNFTEVMEMLERPADFGIDDATRRELFKEPGKLYALFGDSFLEAGQPGRAEQAFKKAQELARGREKAAHAYRFARLHAARNEHAKALEQLQVYLDSKGTSEGTAPYELLAEVLKKTNRADNLVPQLEKAREKDKSNPLLSYYLAQRLHEAGKLDQALAVYQEMHRRPSVQSYQGLLAVLRAKKDEQALLKVLGECATESGGLDSFGDELESLIEDEELVAKIIAAAKAKLEAGPDKLDYGSRLAAAMLAMEAQEWGQAEEFFNLALETKPKEAAEVYMYWGLGLLSEEKYAEAAAIFQRGLDANVIPKENPAFHFYLSGALEMAGKTDDALVAARKAAELAADSPRMHSRVAWILYHAKRYDEAAKAYADLIEKFDATNGTAEGRQVMREARLVLSALAVMRKDIPQAEEWLEQVLDEFPDDISARNDLGYLWADQGKNLPRALEMTREAVAAEPENEAYRDSLGWALYRLGRYEEALVELKKAASGDRTDGVILDHLGDCYDKLGDKQNALDAWRRALKAYDVRDHAEDIEKTKKKIGEAE